MAISLDQLSKTIEGQKNYLSNQLGGIGLTWDPATNSFIHDPSYIRPDTSTTVGNIYTETGATANAQNALPAKPADLTNIVDSSGVQAPLGTTGDQLNSGKYHILSSDEKTRNDLIKTADSLYGLIAKSSMAINKHNGINGGVSPTQLVSGLGDLAMGNPDAQFLHSGVKGFLNPFAEGLLSVGRFSPQEIDAIQKNVPSPYDSKQQAGAKLDRLKTLMDSAKKSLGNTAQTADTTQAAPTSQGQPAANADPLGIR